MPFITQERRQALANGEGPQSVGDLCYLSYKDMVRIWKEHPRWRTAHAIYSQVVREKRGDAATFDQKVALDLAWQIFVLKHLIQYEDEKEKENGTI